MESCNIFGINFIRNRISDCYELYNDKFGKCKISLKLYKATTHEHMIFLNKDLEVLKINRGVLSDFLLREKKICEVPCIDSIISRL